MNTHHASYQRASREQILRDYSDLRSLDYVTELIHALPYIATILNHQRQIGAARKTRPDPLVTLHPETAESLGLGSVYLGGVPYWIKKLRKKYKLPKEIEFRLDLPKTNVGKILRKALKSEELAKRAQS